MANQIPILQPENDQWMICGSLGTLIIIDFNFLKSMMWCCNCLTNYKINADTKQVCVYVHAEMHVNNKHTTSVSVSISMM